MFPLKDNIQARRFPVLTVALIAINVIVFFGFEVTGISLDGAKTDSERVVEYGLIPYELTNPGENCGVVTQEGVNSQGMIVQQQGVACQGKDGFDAPVPDQRPVWITIFTAMFMHGGLLHIAGNMLFLWIFGNNIEDSMSRWRFIAFYLAGGIAASLAQVAIDPSSTVPTIGASGAIAAVLGGYAILYPRARVVTMIFIIFFFTVIELPALLVLGAWFLLQLFYGSADLTSPVSGGGGGVAYFAHIGGFVAGMILIKVFANRIHYDYEQPQRLPVY